MPIFYFLLQIAPVQLAKIYDTPNDKGGSITIEWELSKDDSIVSYYRILRKEGEEFKSVGIVARGNNKFDDKSVKNKIPYWYKIRVVGKIDSSDYEVPFPGIATAQWFHHKRWNVLILGLIICFLAIWFINKAKKGEFLFVRKISGLDAVDDAVGRATEMGRPILFTTGLGMMSDISTIAALIILNRVAKRAALHNTPVIVPCYDPIVMSAAQEVVKEAYMEVGRPDLYDERKIFYLTQDQFGYAAGVDGIMIREKPGAIFLQGYFYAESLILAETGNSIGAIQIAGTPATTQLPFFIAACDYTLIGEEMFAASSYLSREPNLLGSIKGEDYAKIIIIAIIGIGVILSTLSSFGILKTVASFFVNLFSSL